MFTGIIQAVGTISALTPRDGDVRLEVDTADLGLDDVALGDSIAVNGVCLTVVESHGSAFIADVSNETLALTTIGHLQIGDQVNLEKALTPQTRLGGHWASGHVDGVGEIVERTDDARSIRFAVTAPTALAKYIARKGSISVDGISLTVNDVEDNVFYLNIIPHTAEVTTMGQYRVGTRVNLEVDIIARYLERLSQFNT
ncbi:riboflavin synthase [bacterium]|nr:riboflavin synthase [bacterium]